MKAKNTKLKASVLIILLIPFYACGQTTQKKSAVKEELKGYVQIDYSVKKNTPAWGTEFIDICHKNLEIRIYQYDGEIYNRSLIKFFINGRALNHWSVTPFEDVDRDMRKILVIYYSPQRGDYYVFFSFAFYDSDNSYIDFDAYHIMQNKIEFMGSYMFSDKNNISDPNIYENTYKFYMMDDTFKIAFVDAEKKEYMFRNYDRKIDSKPIDKSVLKQADNFDWEKAFSPSVFYKEGFSFNSSGEEKYKIDWDKREITPLNNTAKCYLDMIAVDNPDSRIEFSKDTLIIKNGYYERDWDYLYSRTYYFLKSDDLNDVILNKVILYKHVAEEDVYGTDRLTAIMEVKYLYNDFGNISFHDFNETNSPYKIRSDNFPLESYNRDLTLSELVKIVSNKKDVYRYNQEERIFGSGYSSFYIYPKPEEIFLRLKKTPLTLQTVEDYNNIAYYILEFAKSHEQADSYTDAAVKLLEKIIVQFPDRVVTYLNLGDAYWQRDYNGDRSKARTAYKKYIELMQAQQKDMNRIPKRVPERIGSNK